MLTLPKDFLKDNNDSKLTMLGGRLFQTLTIRSLKMFSHINTTMVDEQFIWVPASCSSVATSCSSVLIADCGSADLSK